MDAITVPQYQRITRRAAHLTGPYVCLFVLLAFSAGSIYGQGEQARRLDLEHPPARAGVITAFVGDEIADTTSAVNWLPGLVVTGTVFADPDFRTAVDSSHAGFDARVEGRGKDQRVITRIRLHAPGTYQILKRMVGTGKDDGLRHRYGFYWTVYVRWPVIADLMRTEYAYGEGAYFNFAAGHPDYRKYSYEVFHGPLKILGGSGPLLPIDTLWKNLDHLDVPLTLRAFYDGKPFPYLHPASGDIGTSSWIFRVTRPDALVRLTLWQEADTVEARRAPFQHLDMAQQTPFLRPGIFRFSYSSATPSGFIFTRSPIQKSSVTSDPPEFLLSGKTHSWMVDGIWNVLVLHTQAEFLRRIPRDGAREVTLTIEFVDEFRSFSKRYKALVYERR